MANTYSQIFIHGVFAVKNRACFITKEWRDDLHRYISGTIKGEGAKPLAVNGWKDHVHVFFGLPVAIKISDLMGSLKANSSKWVNDNKLIKGKFNWQPGYGAFSYSKSQRDSVVKYIMKQEQHHKVKTFHEEYLKMLTDFEVEYDKQYLFEFFD